jgi:hypothetical protein
MRIHRFVKPTIILYCANLVLAGCVDERTRSYLQEGSSESLEALVGANGPMERAAGIMAPLKLTVDTVGLIEIVWPVESKAWDLAGAQPVTEGVIRADGSAAIYVSAIASIVASAPDGRLVAYAKVRADSARDPQTRGQLHSVGSGGVVFYDVGERLVTFLDARLNPARRVFAGVARQYPTLSSGVVNDGVVIFVVGREKVATGDGLFRRVFDVVATDTTGTIRVVRSRIEGATEARPKELRGGGGNAGPSRIQMRYPAQSRYFTQVAAYGNRIFVMLSPDSVAVLSVDGSEVGRWSRPVISPPLEVRSDTTFSSEEVVPLGMRTDSFGNLWLERPRTRRDVGGIWDIIGSAGQQKGEAVTPSGCRVMAFGFGRVLCQFRLKTDRYLPRLVVYRFVNR